MIEHLTGHLTIWIVIEFFMPHQFRSCRHDAQDLTFTGMTAGMLDMISIGIGKRPVNRTDKGMFPGRGRSRHRTMRPVSQERPDGFGVAAMAVNNQNLPHAMRFDLCTQIREHIDKRFHSERTAPRAVPWH